MAGREGMVGVTRYLLGLSRREAGPTPVPALAQATALRLGPKACIPSRFSQWDGQTWDFP